MWRSLQRVSGQKYRIKYGRTENWSCRVLKSLYFLRVKWVSRAPMLSLYEIGTQKTISNLVSFANNSQVWSWLTDNLWGCGLYQNHPRTMRLNLLSVQPRCAEPRIQFFLRQLAQFIVVKFDTRFSVRWDRPGEWERSNDRGRKNDRYPHSKTWSLAISYLSLLIISMTAAPSFIFLSKRCFSSSVISIFFVSNDKEWQAQCISSITDVRIIGQRLTTVS